ncbi:hypothetical protein OIN59_09940 [Acidovorax sp. D2M1]|uniref:Uncharacterized protein n=1 Tax=Acidovorax benzenivorans TaxID=2987520 RepID=A0ABT5RX34_9BURK|nr:hypothetical protein [Acidovorax benzenivorans]MDD2177756.1 hypothetical protein [Acidovorax benzenivorans]
MILDKIEAQRQLADDNCGRTEVTFQSWYVDGPARRDGAQRRGMPPPSRSTEDASLLWRSIPVGTLFRSCPPYASLRKLQKIRRNGEASAV